MSVELVADERPGGVLGKFFCSAPHPTNGEVWCRRQPEHDDDHAAFVFSIKEPEQWAK